MWDQKNYSIIAGYINLHSKMVNISNNIIPVALASKVTGHYSSLAGKFKPTRELADMHVCIHKF